MPIEGALRELGIHDVFQMLDLSRKTGALTVTSASRDNRGTVYFERGSVVQAQIRSNPYRIGEMLLRAGKITGEDLSRARAEQDGAPEPRRLGEILVQSGAITWRELERQVRLQIEQVVFELMSWRDGFFSFEEGPVAPELSEMSIRVPTEALLMEGARRIDEWSRMERRIPNLGVLPILAPPPQVDEPAGLDLRPEEWEVLVEVDGETDLRGIAARLARSEFEVAKTVYGLMSTGLVTAIEAPPAPAAAAHQRSAVEVVEEGVKLLRDGNAEAALQRAREAVATYPESHGARLLVGRALGALGRHDEAAEALRLASTLAPDDGDVLRETGDCAARRGEFALSRRSWQRYLAMTPDAPDASLVRERIVTVTRLQQLLREFADVR